MATFYLLPPRPLLNQRFTELARRLLPDFPSSAPADFVSLLHELACAQPDTYLIHREDLPSDEDPVQALIDGFGAEPGDDILEIRAGSLLSETSVRRWSVGHAA
jgi:hypothetical protein